MPTFYQITLVALATAFILLFLTKTEWRYTLRDFCAIIGFSKIAEMLDCDFCFSFWLSLGVSILFAIILGDLTWAITPIFSTPLIRILL